MRSWNSLFFAISAAGLKAVGCLPVVVVILTVIAPGTKIGLLPRDDDGEAEEARMVDLGRFTDLRISEPPETQTTVSSTWVRW